MCKKMGLSQQGLADLMEIKRGKVAGYFYETQARPDFYNKLGEKFGLNIGRFLTIEMNDENYTSFFEKDSTIIGSVAEEKVIYQRNSTVLDLLIQVKNCDDSRKRDEILDEVIKLYGKIIDENSSLKDTNSKLKDDLLDLTKKLISN